MGGNKFQSPVLSNIYVLPDIRSNIYFEIVGPTAFLSVRTDGFLEVWNKCHEVKLALLDLITLFSKRVDFLVGVTALSSFLTLPAPGVAGLFVVLAGDFLAGEVFPGVTDRFLPTDLPRLLLLLRLLDLLDLDVDLPLAGDLDERV